MKTKLKEKIIKKFDLVPRRRGQCGHCGSMKTINEFDRDGTKFYFCEDCNHISSPPTDKLPT